MAKPNNKRMKRKNTNGTGTQVRARRAQRESSRDAGRVPPVDLSLRINDVAAVAENRPVRKRRKPFVL